ncbi:beta-ketoacyl-[acyl-carrier-protein] synthase family protein [Streptomyces aureocirculatus]|uniref:beta-ketoacyl-[acyl-carrier-protein] synthase family protein n=1 Tax=Streptomyces aureocirculatus TaxID=67275 RepID=UPI00068A3735|nr:beta-ketoacyl-[acyl-carrier-protein] synthase family protein [Streptomyces aureocirculatus]
MPATTTSCAPSSSPSASPSNDRAVAVTGIGMLTPAGADTDTTWATMGHGRGLARRLDPLAGLPVEFGCAVSGFDPVAELGHRRARRLDRFTHLALAAARRAVADAVLDTDAWNSPRVGVILGVGSNSLSGYVREFTLLGQQDPDRVSPLALPRSIPNMAAAEVAIDLSVGGPSFTVASACASGATAIGIAQDLVTAGTCDIVLAGGAESGLAPMTATCFARMRALSRRPGDPSTASRPFDTDRDGFVLSEGAAVLVLEHPRHARRRGAPTRALLQGHASTSDAHHFVAPHPDGAGAEAAVRAALAASGHRPRDIGHINAHGTSTRAGDTAEALALLRVFGTDPPPVTAPKSVLGHALGASGAIEAALTVLTLQHQLIPPTANLTRQDPELSLNIVTDKAEPAPMTSAITNAFGFGGHNTVLVFSTP